jgi:hypothetical protein
LRLDYKGCKGLQHCQQLVFSLWVKNDYKKHNSAWIDATRWCNMNKTDSIKRCNTSKIDEVKKDATWVGLMQPNGGEILGLQTSTQEDY